MFNISPKEFFRLFFGYGIEYFTDCRLEAVLVKMTKDSKNVLSFKSHWDKNQTYIVKKVNDYQVYKVREIQNFHRHLRFLKKILLDSTKNSKIFGIF